MRRALSALRWLLLAIALPLLAWCGYTLLDTWSFNRMETIELDPQAPGPPHTPGLIGRIEIARLGVSAVVMEGTTDATLRHAAGHISGTVLPGQVGNVGISAHRDTLFRPLRNVRQNDVVVLTTPDGEYRYSVVSTRIVEPSNIAVLANSAGETLTLVTCYPFYFIGAAPSRFIVRAKRI